MPFPLDAKWIEAMEREMGVKFPPIYRGKLAKENGGELTTRSDAWQLSPVFDQTDRRRIARTCNSITSETKKQRSWPRFPFDAVAIGSNGYGDILILLPHPNDPVNLSDVIYWWNHETGQVQKIADDVAELYVNQSGDDD